MNIANFVHYFQRLAKAHNNLRGFFYMNESRLKNFQPNKIEYPCMMFYAPTILCDNTDVSYKKIYKGSFAVLGYTEVDNFDYQDYVSNECDEIAHNIILKMYQEDTEGFIVADVSCELVKGFTHDNLYGWLVSFSLEVSENECEKDVWNEDILNEDLENIVAGFSFENLSDTNFEVNLAVTLPSVYDSYEFSVIIDKKTVPLVADSFVYNKKLQFPNALVTLKVIKDGKDYFALAYIRNKKYSGESVPFFV